MDGILPLVQNEFYTSWLFVFSLSLLSKWNHAVCVSSRSTFRQHVAKQDDKLRWLIFSPIHSRNILWFMKQDRISGIVLWIILVLFFSGLGRAKSNLCAHLPGNIWIMSPFQHWAEQPSLFPIWHISSPPSPQRKEKKTQIFHIKIKHQINLNNE